MQAGRSGWTTDDAVSALAEVLSPKDEVVFIHSNLAFLGRASNGNSAASIYNALRAFPTINFVLPAFDYSFGHNSVFNLDIPPRRMGALTTYAFGRNEVIRTLDPMFSCLIVGQNALELASDLPSKSFGPNSLFDRILRSEGSFLSINLDMGSTLCHELEYRVGVPFRYEKTFEGTFAHEPGITRRWVSYVRDLNLVGDQDFSQISANLEEHGLVVESKLGRGKLRAIRLSKYSKHISSMLDENPWVMISKLDGVSTSRKSNREATKQT